MTDILNEYNIKVDYDDVEEKEKWKLINRLIYKKDGEWMVNTELMIKFIDKYEADTIVYPGNLGHSGSRLFYITDMMTTEQIDMLFQHKISPFIHRASEEHLLHIQFFYDNNGPYVLQKILDQDDANVFLHSHGKLRKHEHGDGKIILPTKIKEYAQYMDEMGAVAVEMVKLIDNYALKQQNLMGLLKQQIE